MFQITNLFLYKLVFTAALLIAEALFLFRQKKRPGFPIRMAAGTAIMFLVVAAFPILSYTAVYSSLMFSLFFLLSILLTKFCYDISWRACLFCTAAGYTLQHLASVCYDLATTLGGFEHAAQFYSDSAVDISPFSALIFVEVYGLVYWCLYQFFGRRLKKDEAITIKSPALLALLVLILLVEIILNAFVVYRKYESLDLVYYLSGSLTNIICSISVLVIQFSLLLSKSLEDELAVVNQMWRQEQRQYQISKETIDLINMKCHDMKHQIHNISKQAAIDPAALREMEETISIYDSIVKTGNQALDIILAEKSLYCQKNGIFISYMADGEKLSFMSGSDIYSLFGNMLDNAIQTVIQLEQDKRVIGVTIRAEGELLSINSHNYYSGDVRMEHGLPVTSKEDKNYHGFGVKSMVMIVEKYGGTISFDARDQIFNLNILLPLSSGGQTN